VISLATIRPEDIERVLASRAAMCAADLRIVLTTAAVSRPYRRLVSHRFGSLVASRSPATGVAVAVPALVLLFGLFGTAPIAAGQREAAPDVLGYLLIAVAGMALVLRRRRPLVMIGVVGPATALYLALDYVWGPILLALPVAAYAVARSLPPRRAVITATVVVAVITAGLTVRVARGAETWDWAGLLAVLGVIITPAVAGGAVRALHRSTALLQAERDRRVAADERLRLAGEVHDVVGHGLAVIAMQSGVALHLLDDDQPQARTALEAILATSRESLNDLRRELGRFQDPEVARSDDTEVIGPADFDLLVERLRSDGRDVDADVSVVETLPDELRRLSYRVVREALTNIIRHAGDAAVSVVVRLDRDALRVEVVDTGRRAEAAGIVEGQGIRGMRSRVEASGGTFTAGPSPAGGFAVRAVIPTAGARS
jgi:signal transduction histidine kinase